MSDVPSKAYARINSILDSKSFVEIGKSITARSTDFNLDDKKMPGDGVVTGYGLINNQLVYIYSQDISVIGGTVGEMHAKKIANIYDMAMKMGAPIIGCLDCGGIRLEESFDALEGLGTIYKKQVEASGVIPSIVSVFGQAGGGLSFVAGLSDFTFISDNAKLFVNAPNTIDDVNEEKNDTSCADFQGGIAGNIDYSGTEEDVFSKIRSLVTMLPTNNCENMSYIECTDDLNRMSNAEQFIGDPCEIAKDISDNNMFFEIKSSFAKEMVIGFIKLNGITIGIIGNRNKIYANEENASEELTTKLTANGCKKAADFVNFCDAFSIPIVTFTDVDGFKTTKCEERRLNREVSYLISSFVSSTCPKINVITGKAYGSAYVAMNSKAIGADMVFAYESASVGMMDSKVAAKIMFEKESSDVICDKASEYENLQQNIEKAAARGIVDTIINPCDTRKHLIAAFEMLFTKSCRYKEKKHLNV